MSKSWNLPAGTPKDVVDAYRTAARKMMADPDFQAKRAKIFGPFEQTIGDEAIIGHTDSAKRQKVAREVCEGSLPDRHQVVG